MTQVQAQLATFATEYQFYMKEQLMHIWQTYLKNEQSITDISNQTAVCTLCH
jgi:hypothetical protein